MVASGPLGVVGDLGHDVLPTLDGGGKRSNLHVRFRLREVGGRVGVHFLLDPDLGLVPALLLLLSSVPTLLLSDLVAGRSTARLQTDTSPGVQVGVVDHGVPHQVGGGARAVAWRRGR